jgi:acetyltransferase-like isoleucine patch superfamily enzyme
MSENIAQVVEKGVDGKMYIQYDWYPKAIPVNLVMEDMVYLDSMYSFACFHSQQPNGFKLGYASGNYLHSHFLVGEKGKVCVGKYVVLEATNILANDSVTIGDYCMFSWGSYVTDSWLNEETYSFSVRKEILKKLADSKNRYLDIPNPKPVIIEENVWVGFDAVILPGVRLGRGSVIGCKTVISEDVPPYAVIVGDPARIVKYLHADDTIEERKRTIDFYTKA